MLRKKVSHIVADDVRSNTGKNCHNMLQEFNLDPWTASPAALRAKHCQYEVPDLDRWRLPLLTNLLNQRFEIDACGEDTETVDGLIESLCSS